MEYQEKGRRKRCMWCVFFGGGGGEIPVCMCNIFPYMYTHIIKMSDFF